MRVLGEGDSKRSAGSHATISCPAMLAIPQNMLLLHAFDQPQPTSTFCSLLAGGASNLDI